MRNSDHQLTLWDLHEVNTLRATKWHPGFPYWETPAQEWNLADWSNAMQGEAGEAGNVVKKIRRHETGHPGSQDPNLRVLLEKLGEELADTLIYLDLVATKAGINLAEAVKNKFNAVSDREGFSEKL